MTIVSFFQKALPSGPATPLALPEVSKLGKVRAKAKEKAKLGLPLDKVNTKLQALGSDEYVPSYIDR